MMTLEIQIKSFVISIIFGILFSFFIDLIYKKKIFNVLVSFIFVIIFTFIYFLTLLKLNNAIIHPYYVISFIIGFVLHYFIKKMIKKLFYLKKNDIIYLDDKYGKKQNKK